METTNPTFVQSFDFLPERARRYAEAGFLKHNKDLLTLAEAYEFITVSRATFYRLVKAGKIISRHIAGSARFDLAELALFKSGEVLPAYILPNPTINMDAPKKRRGRIPAVNNSDELLDLLNS